MQDGNSFTVFPSGTLKTLTMKRAGPVIYSATGDVVNVHFPQFYLLKQFDDVRVVPPLPHGPDEIRPGDLALVPNFNNLDQPHGRIINADLVEQDYPVYDFGDLWFLWRWLFVLLSVIFSIRFALWFVPLRPIRLPTIVVASLNAWWQHTDPTPQRFRESVVKLRQLLLPLNIDAVRYDYYMQYTPMVCFQRRVITLEEDSGIDSLVVHEGGSFLVAIRSLYKLWFVIFLLWNSLAGAVIVRQRNLFPWAGLSTIFEAFMYFVLEHVVAVLSNPIVWVHLYIAIRLLMIQVPPAGRLGQADPRAWRL
uniref:Uncharacterized protein n=1 Tax=Riboviria sp. TaxID=2585031 RepID=A0A514D0D9_9VIRU|nr:MAG: hypothetical protein H3Bulk40135_000003 [Riboviria sp.]